MDEICPTVQKLLAAGILQENTVTMYRVQIKT